MASYLLSPYLPRKFMTKSEKSITFYSLKERIVYKRCKRLRFGVKI